MAFGQYRLFLLMFATLLLFNGVSAATEEIVPGGYTPIKNINDPHVQELGEYAVTVHNRQVGKKWNFDKVIYGETQEMVKGMNYKLLMQMQHGSLFEAVVYENRELSSMKPMNAWE